MKYSPVLPCQVISYEKKQNFFKLDWYTEARFSNWLALLSPVSTKDKSAKVSDWTEFAHPKYVFRLCAYSSESKFFAFFFSLNIMDVRFMFDVEYLAYLTSWYSLLFLRGSVEACMNLSTSSEQLNGPGGFCVLRKARSLSFFGFFLR